MPAAPFLARMLTPPPAGPGVPAPPAAPPTRRRAGRAVAWGVLLFAGVQVGLGLAAERYPRLKDPFYGDKEVKLRRRLSPPETPRDQRPPVVVMLGTSRTGLGFHGKRVEAVLAERAGRPAVAFNFGIPASGPITHLVYLRRLLAAGVVPDLLLLEILPSMLSSDPNVAPLEKNWLLGDRLLYGEQDVVVRHGFDAGNVRDRYARSVLLPWYTLRFPLLSRVSPSWVPLKLQTRWSQDADECGWGKMLNQDPTPEAREKGFRQATLEYGPTLTTLAPGGPAADALRELLALARDRGVPVRLVLMPESRAFRGLYDRGDVPRRLRDFLDGVTAEFGLPAATDARDWLDDGEPFYDGHHLLETGAERFSDRLARDVIAGALPVMGDGK